MSTAAQRAHLAQFVRRDPAPVTAEQSRRLAKLDAWHSAMTKGERREAKRHRAQHGMRVTNTSIRRLGELSVAPKGGKKR